jgi:hypothetical protein
LELYSSDLFQLYQQGLSVSELSLKTGLPEELVEDHIREMAWEILGDGLDRSFSLPIARLDTFNIQWDLVWDC